MHPNHLLLSGFKECQAYHNSHSYQLPNHPCLSVCQHHSFSLWLQVMKDLLKFPQLPVTSYTLSSLYFATMSPHHLLMCSYYHSLSVSGFKEWKTYQSSHSYQLPVTPFPPSTLPLCLPIIYYTLWLQVMKDLLKFPQLPLLTPAALIIYLCAAPRNVPPTTISTITSSKGSCHSASFTLLMAKQLKS